MAKFNLSEYDQVADRIKSFYKDNPEGRIVTHVLFQDGERTIIKASVYLNFEEQEKGCPKATGIAEEVRIVEMSVSSSGKEYEAVNFSAWTENCETSAIGRALANWKYSGSKRPSREEMQKVERMQPQCPGDKEEVKAKSDYGLGNVASNTVGEKCPGCGSVLVEREGKFGKFLGCSKYPECKFIKK
jgi:hypothetical protein